MPAAHNVADGERLIEQSELHGPTTADNAFSQSYRSIARSWFALGMIMITFYAGALNQQILILSMESLKIELGLTDTQIGFLFSTPGVCAGIGALMLGVLADRAPRQIVLAACILMWSLATVGLGLATQFIGIFLGIVALAFGESALGPVVNSMVPDLFTEEQRVSVNLILTGASVIAAGVATMAAGSLIAVLDMHLHTLNGFLSISSSVRGAFFVAGLMGVPIAVAVLCIGDIKRKFQNSMDISDLRKYLRIHSRAIFGLYSAFAMQSAGVVALSTWIPTYLTRRFEMSAAEVGEGIGKAVISGSVMGILLSLAFTRWLFPKFGRRLSYIIYFAGVLTAMIPTLLQLTAKDAEMTLWLTFFTVSLLTMATGHTASMLQDVSPSQLRGRIFAIATLFMSVIPSAAPSLVGLISDGSTDSSMGLIQAICTVTTTCFIFSCLVLYISKNSIISALNDLRAV